jgi:hypothetical protein
VDQNGVRLAGHTELPDPPAHPSKKEAGFASAPPGVAQDSILGTIEEREDFQSDSGGGQWLDEVDQAKSGRRGMLGVGREGD